MDSDDQSCFYSSVPSELQHGIAPPDLCESCADTDAIIDAHKTELDVFLCGLEQDIATVNWGTAECRKDE